MTKQAAALLLLCSVASAPPALATDKPARKQQMPTTVTSFNEDAYSRAMERYTSESAKATEICRRDNFGKTCDAAQKRVDQYMRELEKVMPEGEFGADPEPPPKKRK